MRPTTSVFLDNNNVIKSEACYAKVHVLRGFSFGQCVVRRTGSAILGNRRVCFPPLHARKEKTLHNQVNNADNRACFIVFFFPRICLSVVNFDDKQITVYSGSFLADIYILPPKIAEIFKTTLAPSQSPVSPAISRVFCSLRVETKGKRVFFCRALGIVTVEWFTKSRKKHRNTCRV